MTAPISPHHRFGPFEAVRAFVRRNHQPTQPRETLEEPAAEISDYPFLKRHLKRLEQDCFRVALPGIVTCGASLEGAVSSIHTGNATGAVLCLLLATGSGYFGFKELSDALKIEVAGEHTAKTMRARAVRDPSCSVLPDQPEKKWTVMYYMSGANDLHQASETALKRLTRAGSDDNVTLVAQISTYGTRRGKISAENPGGKHVFDSEHLGMRNMGDSDTLKEFILWSMKKFPAQHFALVLQGHGAGFLGSMNDYYAGSFMRNSALGQALRDIRRETGQQISLVGFDACQMANLAALYDLRGGTPLVLASEESLAGSKIPIGPLSSTLPHSRVIQDLQQGIRERGDIKPEELGTLFVREAGNQFGAKFFSPTVHVFRISDQDNRARPPIIDLTDAALALALYLPQALKGNPVLKRRLQCHIRRTQRYNTFLGKSLPYSDYRDLGDFAKRLMRDQKISDPKIKTLAADVLGELRKIVIAGFHADESITGKTLAGSSGISVWLPAELLSLVPFLEQHEGRGFSGGGGKFEWERFLFAVNSESSGRFSGAKQRLFQTLNSNSGRTARFLAESAQYLPYIDAIGMLTGQMPHDAHSISPFTAVVDPVGGCARLAKAMGKLQDAAHSDWPLIKKIKHYSNAAIDVAVGVASAMLPLVGVYPKLYPLVMGALGLGFARGGYEAANAAARAIRNQHTAVEEKLLQEREFSSR